MTAHEAMQRIDDLLSHVWMVRTFLYEEFGTPQEKVTRKTVTLTAGKELHEIATVVVAGERVGGQGAGK
jgi:hypothetical protein